MNLMGNIGAYHAGGMPGLQMYQCQQAFNQQPPIMSQLFPHTMVGMGGLNNGGCLFLTKVNDEKFKKNLIYIHLTLHRLCPFYRWTYYV